MITRPNGKTYRPRKPVSVSTFENYEGESVLVWRTHNVFYAGLLAARSLRERDLDPADVQVSWWREVPWSDSGMYARSLIEDPDRGVPVVYWDI